MIKELKRKKNLLSEIAAELYGDLWIMNEKFWGSPTEKEMMEVTLALIELGETVRPTEEQKIMANEIAKKFNLKLPGEN